MTTAGWTLRQMREKLGLTMRDVETASEKLARKGVVLNTLCRSAGCRTLKPKV